MSQSTEAIVAVVRTLIRRNMREAKSRQITEALELRNDLGANDLDILQLVMDIEDELHIDIDDAEAEGLRTVGDVEILACAKVPLGEGAQ